jgi:hypothetical protein
MSQQNRSILRGPLGASLAALAIIAIFLLVMMPGVYRSTWTMFSGGEGQSEDMDQLIAAHDRNMETDVDRFNGRSLFYLPPVKRRPPPPPPPKPIDDTPPPPPPPPPKPTFPANYTGPALIAILGDEAWFRKNSTDLDPTTRIKAGCVQHGIEVISTNAPRSIRVMYQGGGPYEVELIDLDVDPFRSAAALNMPRGVLESSEPPEDDDNPCPPEQIQGVHVPLDDDETAAAGSAVPAEVPTEPALIEPIDADTTEEPVLEETPAAPESSEDDAAPIEPNEPQSPGSIEPDDAPDDPELNEDEPGLPE